MILPTSPAAHRSFVAERFLPLSDIVVVARFVSPTALKSATKSRDNVVTWEDTGELRGDPALPGCCARAAIGHVAVAPPSSAMNSRRLSWLDCISVYSLYPLDARFL